MLITSRDKSSVFPFNVYSTLNTRFLSILLSLFFTRSGPRSDFRPIFAYSNRTREREQNVGRKCRINTSITPNF